MISVEAAKELLFARIGKSDRVMVNLEDAWGCILAEDVFSPINLPSFDQSAMDGYALSSGNKPSTQYTIVGEIKAGDLVDFALQPGQAARIFTGGHVPAGADTIVIQENVRSVNGTIQIEGSFKTGDCIRTFGSQIKKDELALAQGSQLNPASIGLLASLGINKVTVYKKPDVSIIVTGNELINPGRELKPGQIYESNSFSLLAALKQQQINPKHILTSTDESAELKNKIESCLGNSDILILTGGISVGKYDLVYDTLNTLGAETIFYKVAQKPGKPFYCGKINSTLIFALPGNPAAVLVCFYEYIYPAIRMLRGFKNAALPRLKLNMLKSFPGNNDRALFLRAKKIENGVMPVEKQDSNMLLSFSEADALIYIPVNSDAIHKDDEVEVHLLPFQI